MAKQTQTKAEGFNNSKILGKLMAIATELGFIGKDAHNAHSDYEYASERAIKLAFKPKFVEHKVLFFLDCVDIFMLETERGKITAVKFEYQFVDAESGEYVDGTFIGTGNGRDDKGNYAAVTGAIKYILTSNFLIPTGDDPEDNKNDAGKSAPPAQTKRQPEKEEKSTPAKEAATLDTNKAVQAELDKRFPFGSPLEGEDALDEKTIGTMLEAFGQFDISKDELAEFSGHPIEAWTDEMKESCLEAYQLLFDKVWTKAEFLDKAK